jgi:hypothetical protein
MAAQRKARRPRETDTRPVRTVIAGIDWDGRHTDELSLHIHVHPAEWPQGQHLCVGIPMEVLKRLMLYPDEEAIFRYDESTAPEVHISVEQRKVQR